MSARKIFIGIGIVGLAAFLWFLRDDLLSVAGVILSADWRLLLLIIPLQALNYLCVALYYRRMLGSLGYEVNLWRLYKLSLGLGFTNMALPSAGLSTVSLLAYALKNDGVPTGRSTFLQLSRYAISYVSFLLLLLVATLLMYFSDDITSIAVRIVVLLAFSIVVVSAVGLYGMYDKRAFNYLARKVQVGLDWGSRKLRGGKNLIGARHLEQLLQEFHNSFQEIMGSRAYMKQPLLWSLLATVAELMSLYVIFLSLGYTVNLGIAALAYGISSGLGFLTLLPGDIGVYEVAMTSVFVVSGVPLSFAISATLIYRVSTKLLLILPGFYYYNRMISKGAKHGT